MADGLALNLVEKGLVTDQLVLTVGYDRDSLKDSAVRKALGDAVTKDRYGREIPVHAHGTANLGYATSSGRRITEAVTRLYEDTVNPALLIRRLNLTACHVMPEGGKEEGGFRQLELFSDWGKEPAQEQDRRKDEEAREREKKMQKAVLEIQKKFGKNAVLKGMSLQDGATARERNGQIGGHKA